MLTKTHAPADDRDAEDDVEESTSCSSDSDEESIGSLEDFVEDDDEDEPAYSGAAPTSATKMTRSELSKFLGRPINENQAGVARFEASIRLIELREKKRGGK